MVSSTASSILLNNSIVLNSLILRIKKPPGITIGLVYFFSSTSFKESLTFLLSEFSFIQPILPPKLELSELLNFSAAVSKPSFSIISKIFLDFRPNVSLFSNEKIISERLYSFWELFLVSSFLISSLLIITLSENLLKINLFHSRLVFILLLRYSTSISY